VVAVSLPFDIFNSIIKNLKSEKIHIDYKDRKMNIKADNYEGVVNCGNPKEFPIIPTVEDKSKSFKLKSGKLRDILDRVSTATQYSEIRPEINGVYCVLDNDQFVFAGTDSFRLIEEVLDKGEFESDFDDLDMIIPLNTVDSLLKIINSEGDINVYTDFNQILFEDEKRSIISRLVDGNFPDYKNVIPKDTELEVAVDREELINAIKLTKNFAGKASDIVFKVSNKVLEVYSSNDTMGENSYRVPITIKGDKKEIEVSFNWRYVLDGLRVYDEDKVTLGFNKSEKPAVIKSKQVNSLVYVVMPIRQ
jgi:DNA polymerase-3 subunit beta